MDKIVYCVEADPRPTCVLDLDALDEVYKNPALQKQEQLLDDILDPTAPAGFQAWVLDSEHNGFTRENSIYAYTIDKDKDKRWRVIQWQHSEKKSADEQNGQHPPAAQALPQNSTGDPHSDSLTLDRRLNDATGRLSNLLKMMEMVDVGMFEYDKQGVLVYGNEAFHRLSGVPPNEATPMAWAAWVFEEDRPDLVGIWDSLCEGTSKTFDMRWVGTRPDEMPNGQWVSAACVPTTDEEGNVTTISGCITDISAQKRSHMDAVKRAEALERAQASEQRFANFIKHSNVAFYNFNMDRKVRGSILQSKTAMITDPRTDALL